MPRVKGNNLPLLTLKNGSAALVDLGAYVVNYEFTDGDGDALTQSDYASGVKPVALEVEFALDFTADSAFDYLWTNAGATGVNYVLQPKSGTASQTNPKFSGTCSLPAKPLWGVEAGTEEQTFSVTIELDTYNKAIS